MSTGEEGEEIHPDACRIAIITSTGFDVHDTQRLLENKLGIFILPDGCSPFNACCVSRHLKPHQSTNGDFYLIMMMMRPHECSSTATATAVPLVQSACSGGQTGGNVPVAWKPRPLHRAASLRPGTPTRKGKALPPACIHCRLTSNDEVVNIELSPASKLPAC